MKRDTFLKGAAVLGAAGMLVKVLGAFFRIPLGNIIGSDGMGYYQVGYTIYNFLLAFTAAGFPTAISKLVSEKRAQGDFRGAHKVFKVSFRLLFGLGAAGMLIIAVFAGFLANTFFSNPNAYFAVLAMSPAIFFVSILAAFRGYFQGMKDMKPTALSQIVEQAARVTLGLSLAVLIIYVIAADVKYAAAAASFGAGAGAIAGTLAMARIYMKRKRRIVRSFSEGVRIEPDSVKTIIRDLLKVALPIAIGASVVPMINMFDTFLVVRRLQDIGFTYLEANSLYGQLQGMANTLINLPQVLTVAMAVSLVPVISESFTNEDYDGVKSDTQSAIRVGFLMGLPASIGLLVLAGPIMSLLYPNEPATAGQVLFALAPAVIFLTQVQVLTGILQGLGKAHIPVRNLLIGAFFKLIITYILTGIPAINVRGAAIGTVMAYMIAFSLNLYAVKRETRAVISFRKIAMRPILAAAAMGAVVLTVHRLLLGILGNSLATVIAIPIGGGVYLFMLMITRAVGKADFDLLPKGDRLFKIFNRFGLMKGKR